MSKNPLPATLAPESVVAITDSREQCPLDLSPLRSERGTLDTGDYCLASCPDVVRIERKSLSDLVGCVGSDRERFEREVSRLLAFPIRGKKRTAEVTTGKDGSQRIKTEAATWTAKYRDGSGIVQEVATGCTDKQAAMSILNDLTTRAELVKAKVLSPEQD